MKPAPATTASPTKPTTTLHSPIASAFRPCAPFGDGKVGTTLAKVLLALVVVDWDAPEPEPEPEPEPKVTVGYE